MKYLFNFALCIMSILCTSCWGFEEVDMGYPQSVNFTKDGGEKIVTTDKSKTFISVIEITISLAGMKGCWSPKLHLKFTTREFTEFP